ncbi:MAG: hypothetical protein AUJ92_18555 [Armatimonadetes bacterium CG2_30_59_28]|nr:hypothetical protein [Armatimonadota bacterium]OIO90519.1 MAG: hypothetical protein AUJ92_18555 [Armatimonadetes bacterium CG2_30_59_28]
MSARLVVGAILLALLVVQAVYYRKLLWKPKLSDVALEEGAAGAMPAMPPPPPVGSADARVITFAGDGTPGCRDGSAGTARFDGPSGLAVDTTGNLYVSDSRNHRIRIVTQEGKVSTFAGGGPMERLTGSLRDGASRDARFSCPAGLAFDGKGNLYVADTGNSAIRKVDPKGNVSTVFAPPDAKSGKGLETLAPQLLLPGDVAFDDTLGIAVADTANHRVVSIDGKGGMDTLAGSDPSQNPPEMDSPLAMCIGANGMLYVVGAGNLGVRLVSALGTPISLPTPRVKPGEIIAPVAQVDPEAHPAPKGIRLVNPAGVTTDQRGNLFVSDSVMQCVYATTLSGIALELLAGAHHEHADMAGYVNGNGAEARFNRPGALVCGPGRKLYVADFGNNCVRMIEY